MYNRTLNSVNIALRDGSSWEGENSELSD